MLWLLAIVVTCSVLFTAYWIWMRPAPLLPTGQHVEIIESSWEPTTEPATEPARNATLVIVNGQIRGGILCLKSLKRRILDYYQADLALVIPYEHENDEVVDWEMLARYVLKVKEQDDWGPELSRINRGNTSWEILRQPPIDQHWQFLGGVKNQTGSAGILLAYRYYARVLLRAILEIEHYDWVIYVRADYVYLCSPPPLHNLNPHIIYVPHCENYGGFTDRFTIMTSQKADVYLGITEDLLHDGMFWRELLTGHCGDNANLECLLKLYLNHRGQEVDFFSPVSFTIRRHTDPTRWSAGMESEIGRPFGFRLKYETEYIMATETCREILGSDVNYTEYLSEMFFPHR